MIIYDKIKEKYSKKEVREVLGEAMSNRIWRGDTSIYPFTISKKIDLKDLNYSIDEFFQDYGSSYNNYIEKEMFYNMVMKGYSLSQLKKVFNLESQFFHQITKGFNYNSRSNNISKVFHILGINVDTSNFTIDFYDKHIELFGNKKDLEEFRNKYKIKWEVLYEPYRESWHLAFDGCLAEYIRSKEKKD